MRIVVHDYSGHPFQVQLSRELASHGHETLHLHCPSYHSGKGALERTPRDPETLSIETIELPAQFDKYSLSKRPLQELQYGRLLRARVTRSMPNLVISSNTPLLSQALLVRECRTRGIAFVFWHQDIYSLPIRRLLRRRLPVIGTQLGNAVVALEKRLLRASDAVVTISPDFVDVLDEWGIDRRKIHVVENWAPLDEVPSVEKDNRWAREHGLVDKTVLMYSGTLGVKHDPELLLSLAADLAYDERVRVVVVSEGLGADLVREEVERRRLGNVVLLPFQPYSALPEVLGAGDVLVVLLAEEAGIFAVPSKLLTYLCAGRPILAAVPVENLAAKTVERSGSGFVVSPTDMGAFLRAARALVSDPDLRAELGRSARAYAEETFDINRVADRFERIFDRLSPSGARIDSGQPVSDAHVVSFFRASK